MRKSYLILLSCLSAAPLLSASSSAHAYVYRYAPGVPAVVTHMSVLDPPPPAQAPAPLAVLQAPQELSHPFFTNTVLTPHAVKRATSAVPKPKHLAAKPVAAAPKTAAVEPAAPLKTADVKPVATPEPPQMAAETTAANAPATAAAMPAVPTASDLTLDFSTTSTTLTPQAKNKLDNIAQQMKELDNLRLQIRGYAKGTGSSDGARRMSLSRVLIVRSYLMDKGIKPVRLDVQALGSATSSQPIDRVDLVFVR